MNKGFIINKNRILHTENYKPNLSIANKNQNQQKTILLIDDNLDILELNKMVLEMEGFLVECAQSGCEALKILKVKKAPDLIILDMCMSEVNGEEFLDCLEVTNNKIIKTVPIVIISAMNEDLLNKTQLTKAAGFIRKPTDVDEFIKQVHYFISNEFGKVQKH